MNLNLDFSAVPRALRGMLAELRQKKQLWPVAILLVAGLVAVPVLLSKSSSPAPATAEVPSTPPPAAGTTLPALNVQTTPSQSRIHGSSRNPFAAAAGSSTSSTATASSGATAGSPVATSTATAPAGSSGGSSSSSTTSTATGSSSAAPTTSSSTTSSSTSGGNPPSIVPVGAKPKPAPSGLTKTQSYDVSLATTNAAGGLNTVDPLERLSVVSSQNQPRLVELGVLQGGRRVLFAVQPGTVVVGPGTCTPGPIDCEILSLGRGQTESVSAAGSSSTTLLAVTRIRVADHGTVAGAKRARRATSAAGRALLNASTSAALSLFQYQPSLGAVVDLRNLSVGR